MEKLGVQSTAQLFPMVLRVLRESGCKILEDIKELRRETAATKNRQGGPRRSPLGKGSPEGHDSAPESAYRKLHF
jgi:hypothetical protein